MKFTKTAFRKALKDNDQTLVWKLTAIKLGHTPTKSEVYELVKETANTQRDDKRAWGLAYDSYRKQRIALANTNAWYVRGAFRQYTQRYYRLEALAMLRRLISEPLTSYTKIAMFGFTHLYFCSPEYGHKDYNKVRTCWLSGQLALDKHGNHYDPQAAWCGKVLALSDRIYAKKLAEATRCAV